MCFIYITETLRSAVLLSHWLDIVAAWRPAFVQGRLWRRAVRQALGTLTAFGRRTLSRALFAVGRQHQDWSADYKLHSRSSWKAEELFQPILERCLPHCPGPFIAVALDDTRVHKTGRKIRTAFFQRDPLSPKFRFNLMWGLRFLQASVLLPLHRCQSAAARALPVRFWECPAIRKPRKKAPPEDWAAYRQLVRQSNLSQRALAMAASLRAALNQAGAAARPLLLVGDNSFCNRTLFTALGQGIDILARARRDLRLCRHAPLGTARFYAPDKFTPQQVCQDAALPWHRTRLFASGRWRRSLRFKQLIGIYWQSGARQRPVRLLVIAPLPYRVPGRGRPHYHQPAFLLTTDLTSSATSLLQAYWDRWQIEVNHREEKDTLGLGQAQLWSESSVPRQPAFVVAAYSALLLAGLLAYGPTRTARYQPLPKWRRHADRPSCLDLITQLRKEIDERTESLTNFGLETTWKSLGLAAIA